MMGQNTSSCYIRRPYHAGSWYDDNGEILDSQLGNWLGNAETSNTNPVRAIIGPHAGYRCTVFLEPLLF